jgi:hypothetical protein
VGGVEENGTHLLLKVLLVMRGLARGPAQDPSAAQIHHGIRITRGGWLEV